MAPVAPAAQSLDSSADNARFPHCKRLPTNLSVCLHLYLPILNRATLGLMRKRQRESGAWAHFLPRLGQSVEMREIQGTASNAGEQTAFPAGALDRRCGWGRAAGRRLRPTAQVFRRGEESLACKQCNFFGISQLQEIEARLKT